MATPLEQLPKLLRMLESSFDQEVLAAARKIRGVMVSNDYDWDHLLANGSASALTEDQVARIYSAGLQKGEQLGYQRGFADAQSSPAKARGPSIEISDDLDWLQKILDAAEKAEADHRLDSFESDITSSHRAKLARFGRRTFLSQPQFDSFKRLEIKLRRAGYLID